MCYTYILYSKSIDQYYTGYTSVGVKKRLEKHNRGGNRSTKSGIPWEIAYYKRFATKSEAIKWEKVIKRQKIRKFIEKLIHSDENEYTLT